MIGPVLAGLMCPMFTFTNKTSTWTEKDQQVLVYVTKEGCKRQDAKQPCLKNFVKSDEGVYEVMCGPEEKK